MLLFLALKSTLLCLRGTRRGKGNLGSGEDLGFTLDELGLWANVTKNMYFIYTSHWVGGFSPQQFVFPFIYSPLYSYEI